MSTIACGIIFKDLTENTLKGMSKQYLIKLSLRLSQVYSQDLIQFIDELLANYNNRLSSVTSSQLRQHSTRTLRVWRPWLWRVWKLIVLAVQHLHFQVISNFTKTLSSELVLHKRWKEWRSVICGSEVWEFEITWLYNPWKPNGSTRLVSHFLFSTWKRRNKYYHESMIMGSWIVFLPNRRRDFTQDKIAWVSGKEMPNVVCLAKCGTLELLQQFKSRSSLDLVPIMVNLQS